MTEKAIRIRRAQINDAASIIAVHYAAVHGVTADFYNPDKLDAWSSKQSHPERKAELIENMQSGKEIVLVAESESADIVAFGSIVAAESELRAVYVHPDFGRRGIGGEILAALEKLAREASVTEIKMKASLNAIAFYKTHGYELLEMGEHITRSGLSIACGKMRKILSS